MMTLAEAFAWQSESCSALGSPFMGRLMGLCAAHWPDTGPVARKALDWPGDLSPKAASLPLRIAGGLHALVLSGQAPELAAHYPPHNTDDTALWDAVAQALGAHEAFLLAWMDSPPQTNEVRRAAALIPVAHMLAARFGHPLRISELGASGGLNLNFDHFRLNAGATVFGPRSDVCLAPDWTGPCPAPATPVIAERRGVDLNPLAPDTAVDALRLMAYLWPDQADRLARTKAAIALPPAQVDQSDAIDWIAKRLAPTQGETHLIFTTVAWQYFPPEAQLRGEALIGAQGLLATEETPLAFLRMEADTADRGAALTLRLWPGDEALTLARVDFHGRWIDWSGPTDLRNLT